MAVKTITKDRLSVKELSILYDRIYDIADRLFKKYNPCNIRIENNKVFCTCKIHTTHRQKALCCQRIDGTNCKYWSDGCTIKCLPCKLFVCNAITYEDKHCRHINKKYKVLINRLKRLRNITIKNGIPLSAYFHTKQEILDISEKQKKERQKNWYKWEK